jgi:hypothetical protein
MSIRSMPVANLIEYINTTDNEASETLADIGRNVENSPERFITSNVSNNDDRG